MNSGFSNLTVLKKHLLGPSLAARIDWDVQLQAIGLGVAAQFEKYCARKFYYTVGYQEVFGADRASFVLSLFPVIAPITTVEFKQDEPTGWIVQNQNVPNNQIADNNQLIIRSLDAANGIIYFPDDQDCGEYWSQMRFTYTGGYWWPQLDPGPGYPDVCPAGAPLLPDGLFFAWTIQCRKVWEAVDKLGKNITMVGSNAHNPADVLAGMDLVPQVKELLGQYVRYQLT